MRRRRRPALSRRRRRGTPVRHRKRADSIIDLPMRRGLLVRAGRATACVAPKLAAAVSSAPRQDILSDRVNYGQARSRPGAVRVEGKALGTAKQFRDGVRARSATLQLREGRREAAVRRALAPDSAPVSGLASAGRCCFVTAAPPKLPYVRGLHCASAQERSCATANSEASHLHRRGIGIARGPALAQKTRRRLWIRDASSCGWSWRGSPLLFLDLTNCGEARQPVQL